MTNQEHAIQLAVDSNVALPCTQEQAAELNRLGAAYVNLVHTNGGPECADGSIDDMIDRLNLDWKGICKFLGSLECAGGIMAVDFELDLGDNNGQPCHCLYITYSFQDTPEATTHYFFNLDC